MIETIGEWWIVIRDFLADEKNKTAIEVLLSILAAVGAVYLYFTGRLATLIDLVRGKKDDEEKPGTVFTPIPPGAAGVMTLTIEEYEARLQRRGEEIAARLVGASEEDRTRLESEKSEFASRLADIETSYAKAKETIAGLRETAERYGNVLGAEKLEEARRIFEEGDFDAADLLFARVEDEGDLEVERTAAAAFQRGKIAEEQVRWADAAEHYLRATQLSPRNFEAHRLAGELLWKTGKLDEGEQIIRKLHGIAQQDFSPKSTERATAENNLGVILLARANFTNAEGHLRQAVALRSEILGTHHLTSESLNNLASLLRDMGRHDEAEPLFRQALEITGDALGTDHPSYAIRLGNLAGLLIDTNRLAEAEPLRRREYEIMLSVHGKMHPHFATATNNLAGLLRDMGRHDEAEPLYAQMMPILRGKLGDDHPTTRTGAANYARLLRAHFPDDPALAELEAAFGSDIGR